MDSMVAGCGGKQGLILQWWKGVFATNIFSETVFFKNFLQILD